MNFDDFFKEAHERKTTLKFNADQIKSTPSLSNEALFHIPFLAMTVLMLSKGKRKPRSGQLGRVVGECLEKTLRGFKGTGQHLQWSANLRIRTIKALTFLEMANLVIVEKDTQFVIATDAGKKVIEKATADTSNLSVTLQVIERSYRNMAVEKQIEMEIV